jgi:hypothetical protein
MAKRKNIKWTSELDTKLVSLRRLGVKPREIATIMGISRTAVYSRSFTLGVTKTSAQLEMDFRESPKRRDLPTYIDEVTQVPADYVFNNQPKPKPAWWSAMMWWRK